MGQTLSEPITTKHTTVCSNEYFKVGASCMQGWRISMEDAHTNILAMPQDPEAAYFAVYDGHGGAKVSKYVGEHLHNIIFDRPEYTNGDVPEAMKQGFLEIDKVMLANDEMKDKKSGTTAVVLIIKNDKIFCANVGDSRAIASVNGKVEVLSLDHKPNNVSELKRIKRAGGWVGFKRVNGKLALSRALGDFSYKVNTRLHARNQIVTAYPDVEARTVTKDWEFAVIACDGIWDVMTNEDVVGFVRHRLSSGLVPEDICEQLMSRCLAPDRQMGGRGHDNMTVVIVCFLHKQPFKQLIKRIGPANRRTSKRLKYQCDFMSYHQFPKELSESEHSSYHHLRTEPCTNVATASPEQTKNRRL